MPEEAQVPQSAEALDTSLAEPREYLLVVPTAESYTLVERVGTLPGRGAVVVLSDADVFEVVRTGPSPLPNDPRTCVYVLRRP